MKHESYTSEVIKKLHYSPKNKDEKNEMKKSVQAALHEISYGISGSSLTAYNSACAVQGGDMEWQEAGTLQEMQTVVLLADLLKLVLDENDKLNND